MKTLRLAVALLLFLILPLFAHGQTSFTVSVNSSSTTAIVLTKACNIVQISENSSSPSAQYFYYNRTVGASPNVQVFMATGAITQIVSSNMKVGDTVALVQASTSGTFSFLVQQISGTATYPVTQTKPTDWHFASVTLNAAQINALGETPVQLIAAQGANTQVVVHNMVFDYAFGTTPFNAYDTNGDYICAYYGGITYLAETGCTSAYPGFYFAPIGTVDSTNSIVLNGLVASVSTAVPDAVPNEPVLIIMPDGAFDCAIVTSATIDASGGGYAVNDVVLVDGITGTAPPAITVTAISGSGGHVTGFSLLGQTDNVCVAVGSETGVTTTAQTGVGTGLTLNTTAAIPGDGTLQVSMWYSVVPVF